MNPIENLWANLKHYLRKTTKPTNKDELVNGIQEYWKTVTPEMCKQYVDHVRKVVPAVVACGGGVNCIQINQSIMQPEDSSVIC